MVRVLKSLTDAGEEIKALPPGTVIQLLDDHNVFWRFLFANGNSFLIGTGTLDCLTLVHPNQEKYASEISVARLIPHVEGPIIMHHEGNLTQHNKPFCHRSGIPEFHSIPSVSRDGNGFAVNSPNGSPCVNITKMIPGLTDYDCIEHHRRGLLVSRGNCVWLVVTEPKKN
jgi:hypothetical protein